MLPAVPKPSGSKRPTISIVGPGNLGSALALTLTEAGYPVSAVVVRQGSKNVRRAKALARRIGAEVVAFGKRPLTTDIVWLAVPDDAIAGVARQLAQSGDWKGKLVFHSSGALTSDELQSFTTNMGARVASVHPMMTFVRGEVPQMAGVAFAHGEAIRRQCGLRNRLSKTWAEAVRHQKSRTRCSITPSAASPHRWSSRCWLRWSRSAIAAGIRKRDIKAVICPLLEQTLRNYLKSARGSGVHGTAGARGCRDDPQTLASDGEAAGDQRWFMCSLATRRSKNVTSKKFEKIRERAASLMASAR